VQEAKTERYKHHFLSFRVWWEPGALPFLGDNAIMLVKILSHSIGQIDQDSSQARAVVVPELTGEL
jgi:hypothetical protein